MPTRIVVADGHSFIRAGIVTMLREGPLLKVAAQTATGPHTVETCRRLRPDVLIMALQLPGLSGLAVARLLSADRHRPRILMQSSQADAATVRVALQAGAAGYMLPSISTADLIAGVRTLHKGRPVLLGLEGILDEVLEPLCSQEVLILKEVARGLENKEIAQLLGISARTVTTHLTSIFGKLGVHNRTTAVERARHEGYLAIE